MTTLDFVGLYDPLTRLRTMDVLPAFEWQLCALTPRIADDRGLRFMPDQVAQPLDAFDLLLVPGGFGTRALQHDASFIDWLRTAETCPLKVSVCTGALLLGAAGFLQGLRATTHPAAFDDLQAYCGSVVDARVVDEGHVITGGVTASIDVGLHVVERLAGHAARGRIARQMDYPYIWTQEPVARS